MKPRLTLRDLFWLVLVAVVCAPGTPYAPETLKVEKDVAEKRVSRVGNSIVIVLQWSSEVEGSTWILNSPDRHVRIAVCTYTMDGSGDEVQFTRIMLPSLKPT